MTATLSDVAAALPDGRLDGQDVPLVAATHDSREVTAGSLFCAVRGARHDGHDFVTQAAERGAAALLVERPVAVDLPRIQVPSTRAAMGLAAAVIHGQPSRDLLVVGITGTNGKTTITYLLETVFGAAAMGTGVIGTVGARIHGSPEPGIRTTPEGTDLQRLLRRMVDRGVDAVAMEVSSHGLALHRVDGTHFALAVFTNLTRDHLDFHGTMEEYFAAKARLFRPDLASAGIVWTDDPWGARLAQEASVPVTSVGTHGTVDALVAATSVDRSGGTAVVTLDGTRHEVSTTLLGGHNLVNAVMAFVAAVVAGVDPEAARLGLKAAQGPPGRLELVDAGQSFLVLVDYAHTPAALARILTELRPMVADGGHLHVVIGAGGDRDPGKREDLGSAATLADRAILTSDNPRSEDPQAILDSLALGARQSLEDGAGTELLLEIDRSQAIQTALTGAGSGDVVVIAGKGHEQVQEFADGSIPFDDRDVAARHLRALAPWS